jgi:MFS family permease
MSTGTSHLPEAASPAPASRHRVWLVVLGAVSVLSVAFALALAYAVTEQNGADLGSAQGWVLVLFVSFVPGILVASTVWLARRPPRRPATFLVLAPVCVVLVMAGVAGMSMLGGRAYDERQGTIAAACSADDIAMLDRLGPYGPDFNGAQGSADGTCGAYWIFPGEDGQAAMATIGSALTADGWVTTDTAWDEKTFVKDGRAVHVSHVRSNEGTTAISVSLVDLP